MPRHDRGRSDSGARNRSEYFERTSPIGGGLAIDCRRAGFYVVPRAIRSTWPARDAAATKEGTAAPCPYGAAAGGELPVPGRADLRLSGQRAERESPGTWGTTCRAPTRSAGRRRYSYDWPSPPRSGAWACAGGWPWRIFSRCSRRMAFRERRILLPSMASTFTNT